MILRDDDCRRMMRAAQDGDRSSYRVLLGAARDWLLRYYARRIAASMVDDLVQETLISVHTKRASYDPERPFYPWLAAIARYRWIDALRRTTESVELEENAFPVAGEEHAVIARLSIDTLLGQLPPAQANAIQLTKIEGLSIREAAEISGQSEALIKVNVHRGVKKLAALVESE